MNIGTVFKNILFPKICLGCEKIGAYFCPACRRRCINLTRHDTICPVCIKPAVGGATHPRCQTSYSPDGLLSLFHYAGIVRTAIKMIKYRRMSDLVYELSGIVITVLLEDSNYSKVFNKFIEVNKPKIVSVPLFTTRKKERWFNQSEEIGKALAKKWNLEFIPDVLVKIKQTKPQAGLKREERLKNVKCAFEIHSKLTITNCENIIVIDDVWTTGATMRECVNVLKRGGVKKVWCLTVAR